MRIELVAEDDEDIAFMWQISQSPKNLIRLSLHCQDGDNTGLIRVDYNSGHNNPEIAIDTLPEIFRPYIGKHFDDKEHHVHLFVEGYRQLEWALPLSDFDIEVKNVSEDSILGDMADAIVSFSKLINVKTNLMINRRLI